MRARVCNLIHTYEMYSLRARDRRGRPYYAIVWALLKKLLVLSDTRATRLCNSGLIALFACNTRYMSTVPLDAHVRAGIAISAPDDAANLSPRAHNDLFNLLQLK